MKFLLFGLILMVSPFLYGEEVKVTEVTKGCVVLYCSYSGSAVMKSFVKVADSEQDDADTDEPQIWGYDPSNVTKDKSGKIIFERVKEKQFIRRGGYKTQGACTAHCPLW
jgi:hypothetical protein